MNAIRLLEADHRRFKRLLAHLGGTTERAVKTRRDLFATLTADLRLHEQIEEEIFYPALKEHPRARDIVLEGYEEHHVVDSIAEELDGVPVHSEVWTAKFSVMRENLEHHIAEEEDDMFPKADRVFEKDELVELGRRMQERRALAGRSPGRTSGAGRGPAGRG